MLAEIERADLWLQDTVRQTAAEVQRETNTIHLRCADRPPDLEGKSWHVHEVRDAWIDRFPAVRSFLDGFVEDRGTSVARAMIVRLQPWGEVYRHLDFGTYYDIRDRFHLVLHSPSGSDMTCGKEAAVFQEREVWWFNNGKHHQAFNHSPDWRIHVIWDVDSDHHKQKTGWKPKAPLPEHEAEGILPSIVPC
jgi:Aspartyl/Asparaginyl beta-hydroxylase